MAARAPTPILCPRLLAASYRLGGAGRPRGGYGYGGGGAGRRRPRGYWTSGQDSMLAAAAPACRRLPRSSLASGTAERIWCVLPDLRFAS